jgi:hypothetical protein
MTSSRSSSAGATLAFTMPLAPPALRGCPLALSLLLWEKGCHAPGYFYPGQRLSLSSSRKWACGWLFTARTVRPPLGESLSFLFMERAKRQVLGPPVPEHR